MSLHIIPSVADEREANRRDSTDNELWQFAVSLSESLLPPGYLAYRDQVHRWREKLADANLALVEASLARIKADRLHEDAHEIERQLVVLEIAHPNWKRGSA